MEGAGGSEGEVDEDEEEEAELLRELENIKRERQEEELKNVGFGVQLPNVCCTTVCCTVLWRHVSCWKCMAGLSIISI